VPARLRRILETPASERTEADVETLERGADRIFQRELRAERARRRREERQGGSGSTARDIVTAEGVWVPPVTGTPQRDPRPSICLRLRNEEAGLRHRIETETMHPDRRAELRVERALKAEVMRACYRWARDRSAEGCEAARDELQALIRTITGDENATIPESGEALAAICPSGGPVHPSCAEFNDTLAAARQVCGDAAALGRLAEQEVEPASSGSRYQGLF
jgi:hypothetical protein